MLLWPATCLGFRVHQGRQGVDHQPRPTHASATFFRSIASAWARTTLLSGDRARALSISDHTTSTTCPRRGARAFGALHHGGVPRNSSLQNCRSFGTASTRDPVKARPDTMEMTTCFSPSCDDASFAASEISSVFNVTC